MAGDRLAAVAALCPTQQKEVGGPHGQAVQLRPWLWAGAEGRGGVGGAGLASPTGRGCTSLISASFFFFLQPYIYIIKISQKFLIFWLAGNNLADVLTPNHMFSFLVWNIWSVAIRLLLQDTLPISGKRAKTSNGRNERSETGSRPAWPGTPLGSAVWEAAGACDREWGGTWGRGSAQ